jgi:hypothetical protein
MAIGLVVVGVKRCPPNHSGWAGPSIRRMQAELAADVETNAGRSGTDDVDGISEDGSVEGGGDDGENEASIDVGYDTDSDGDSGPDGHSTDDEE